MGMVKNFFNLFTAKEKEQLNNTNSNYVDLNIPQLHSLDNVYNKTVGSYNPLNRAVDSGETITLKSLIAMYREVSNHPDVDEAIEQICNTAVCLESENPLSINLDKINIDDNYKKIISKEFDNLLTMLNFNSVGDELFRQFYVDGRFYIYKVFDESRANGIVALQVLDPVKLSTKYENIIDEDGNVTDLAQKLYIYNNNEDVNTSGTSTFINNHSTEVWEIPEDYISFTTSGLLDRTKQIYKSYLHNCIKPLNRLTLLEDSAIIYRFSRAPERRVFYLDTGRMATNKAEEYLRSMAEKFKNTITFDSATGKINQKVNQQLITEDYWFTTGEDNKTKIETLPGGQNISEMSDIDYFKSELLRSLKIPYSRQSYYSNKDKETRAYINEDELLRDELKFYQFVNKLRAKFALIFNDLLKTQLLIKGIVKINEWEMFLENKIKYDWETDNSIISLFEYSVISKQIKILDEIENYKGQYYSEDFIWKNILQLNEIQIAEMKAQMEKEKQTEDIEDEFDDGFGRDRFGGGRDDFDIGIRDDIESPVDDGTFENPDDINTDIEVN